MATITNCSETLTFKDVHVCVFVCLLVTMVTIYELFKKTLTFTIYIYICVCVCVCVYLLVTMATI